MQLVFFFVFLFDFVFSECPIKGSFHETTQFTIDKLSEDEFCCEYFVGSVFKKQLILIIFANPSINCQNSNIFILNGQRETIFDFCQFSNSNPKISPKFSTEDFYVVIKIHLFKPSRLFSTIFLHLIDYNQPIFTTSSSTKSSPLTTKNLNHSFETCGIPSIVGLNSPRIIGGSEAVPNSWPWQVYLTDGNKFCGGTLINDEWVLTASHCVVSPYWKAYLGYHDIRLISKVKEIRVSKIIKHPNYNSTNYNNDISLFKLQTRAEFSSTVGTICLPNKFVANVGKRAVVIGWGKISIQGIFPSKLQETFVEIKNNSECSFYNLQKTQLCAGISVGDIKDSCQGDSGSPMFINDNGRYYLAGIVSFGRSKCDGFGVYTNVFEYLSWIKKTIKYN